MAHGKKITTCHADFDQREKTSSRKRNLTLEIKADDVDQCKPRSNSLGAAEQTSPGRQHSMKLLKGAILHNLLHPLDFYHERKIRSRSNSCSSDIGETSTTEIRCKTPEMRSRSRPSSPEAHSENNAWPVYRPRVVQRVKRPIFQQASCPPVPQTIVSPPSPVDCEADELFINEGSTPSDRHNDQLKHPRSRVTSHSKDSSISSSSYSSDSSFSICSNSGSSNSESEDEASRIPPTNHRKVVRHSSEPPQRSPRPNRNHLSLTNKVLTCKTPSPDPPTNTLLSITSPGPIKSHSAILKPRSKSPSISSGFGSWTTVSEDKVGKKRSKSKKELRNLSKSPKDNESTTEEIPTVSSVERLYSIYDQIIKEGKEGQLHRRHSMETDRKRNASDGTTETYIRGGDPNQSALLFRDCRGLPMAAPFLESVKRSELEQNESQIIVRFFKFHTAYDLIPTSAKLVVFDTNLSVKKAFFALVHNGVRAAPLWDCSKQKYIGMLTITDFIRILQKFYNSKKSMTDLEYHTLEQWRKLLRDENRTLIRIGPDESLYEAIHKLISSKIHRLPVIDPRTGNVLYIITHKRILKFLYLYIHEMPKPAVMGKTIRELNIGTHKNIKTATKDTKLIEAMNIFVENRVSALPIIDENGKLIDIYAKFDAIDLAAKGTYDDLDVTIEKANEYRNEWFEGVLKCTMDETLMTVMDRIVRAEVHRLVVVDENGSVTGIVSLSDLLNELVLKPGSKQIPSLEGLSVGEVLEGAIGYSSQSPGSPTARGGSPESSP